MFKPIAVKALPAFKLWLRYPDGVEGEVDLSHLAGRGIFKIWDDYVVFERVDIGEHGEITWTAEVGLCPDALYLKLTGKRPEEVFPNLKEVGVNA